MAKQNDPSSTLPKPARSPRFGLIDLPYLILGILAAVSIVSRLYLMLR